MGVPFLIVQILVTKTVAIAAAEGSDRAIKEIRKNRYQYVLQNTSRLLSNVKLLLGVRQWKLAAIRCEDFADFTSQLAHVWPQPDENWLKVTTQLRDWSNVFQQGKINKPLEDPPDLNWNYWVQLCGFIQQRIDIESDYDPFG